ncbi:MAG: Glu/Leu/Phe/Val family dehydrogenase, partial [Acidilobaceae archaeon]
VSVTARAAAWTLRGGVVGASVAVQGYGNVGSYAAIFLEEMGAKVVAVSDTRGGIYNSKGLNTKEAAEVKMKTGSVVNYDKAERRISNEELLTLEVDILIPSAIENVITERNAHDVKAKIIAEGANGPVTVEAEKILTDKGTPIVPDILANAGGVITSYIEWVNNRIGGWITEEEARRKLEEKMLNAFNETWNFWETKLDTKKYNLRAAAYAIAVDRVVKAMKLRGWL